MKPQGTKRKPPKRAARRERVGLDDDLAELAAAIDARRVDKGFAGWFSIPWRDGWNAVGLAHHAYLFVRSPSAARQPDDDPENDVALTIARWLARREESADVYWSAGDFIDGPARGAPLLRAALRCVQSRIAHSDAGGESYNAILRHAFDSLEVVPDLVEDTVTHFRMIDAIGYPLDGSPEQVKRSKAFQIAWRRGLFRAAYAV